MTKPDSKRSSVALVTGKPANAAEEQVNNGSSDPSVSGSPHHTLTPATPTKHKSAKQVSRDNLSRRNTESEVFDDGTNTFFWWVLLINGRSFYSPKRKAVIVGYWHDSAWGSLEGDSSAFYVGYEFKVNCKFVTCHWNTSSDRFFMPLCICDGHWVFLVRQIFCLC